MKASFPPIPTDQHSLAAPSNLLIFLWFVISSVLLDIQLEHFQNQKDYGRLGGWLGGIIMGYVVLIIIFWRTIKKKREE